MRMVKRLTTVSLVDKSVSTDYVLPLYKTGDYVVDDSGFQPMSEAVKQLSKTAPLTSDQIAAAYDFPDGKDTGMKVPVERMPRTSDIVEIVSGMQQEAAEVSAKIARINERIANQKQVEDALKTRPSVQASESAGSDSGSQS